jgi:hypothetical protein
MCLTEPVHWFFYTVAGGCCAEAAAMPHQTRLRTNVGPALASLCAELSTEKFEHKLFSLPCRACIVLAPTPRHAVFCSSAQLPLSLLPQMMFTLLSFRLKWRIEVKASLEMPLDGREMPPEAFLVLEGKAVSNNPISVVQGMPGMPNMMGMVSAVFVIFLRRSAQSAAFAFCSSANANSRHQGMGGGMNPLGMPGGMMNPAMMQPGAFPGQPMPQ